MIEDRLVPKTVAEKGRGDSCEVLRGVEWPCSTWQKAKSQEREGFLCSFCIEGAISTANGGRAEAEQFVDKAGRLRESGQSAAWLNNRP